MDAILKNIKTGDKKEHRATVGLFVIDKKSQEVYGLTNKHFLDHADNYIYIKSQNGNNWPLGDPVHNTTQESMDVGIFRIQSELKCYVSNKTEPTSTEIKYLLLHEGEINDLFGKAVIKYTPNMCYYQPFHNGASTTGIIASESEHKIIFGEDFPNGQFLIKTIGKDSFSRPGESGTVIAFKVDQSEPNRILVGMICGETKGYIVFLHLHKVFQLLKDLFGKELEIYNVRQLIHSKNCENAVSVSSQYIPCGVSIFTRCSACAESIPKTPEQIANYTFDLVEHTRKLLYLKFEDPDVAELGEVLKLKQTLSDLVNQRNNLLTCSVFEDDRAEYVAVECGMLACDLLFSDKKTKAERLLKIASFSLTKCKTLQYRLLCEHVTYLTWYKLECKTSESLKQMKTLLDEAIEEFSALKHLKSFPKNSLGYLYNDYSCMHILQYDDLRRNLERNLELESVLRKSAVGRAMEGSAVFRNIHAEEKTPASLTRLILVECQVAFSLLGCGEDFIVFENEITPTDLEKAELILNNIDLEIKDLAEVPLVQRVDYLVALCDIQYRNDRPMAALKTARRCLKELTDKSYQSGLHRIECRLKYLQQKIKIP